MIADRTTWVVVVVSEDTGEARCYGMWRSARPAREFARKLIDRDLDAQPRRIENPTLRNVSEFFGGGS